VPTNGSYHLKRISPLEVAFSDSNPRGESEETILKDETFERLKESVFKFGILVPIVVHEQEASALKPYKLVDGERRLRAALAVGVKLVPAHIAKFAAASDALVQAVHIHMLRKQWPQVAQARAIRRLISERQRSESGFSEEQIAEELRALTGCTDTKLKSLRRAARYSERVLAGVEQKEFVFSHLVQFEESFVEQLEKHYPNLLRKLAKKKVREALVDKARRKVLTSSRALMECVVPVVARAKSDQEKELAESLLEEFILSQDMPAEEVLKKFENKFPSAKIDILELIEKITELTEKLTGLLDGLGTHDLSSFPQKARTLERTLTELRGRVAAKLRAIARAGK
jgi:ParB/RepB/Spo0J family partition protein